MWLAAGGIKGSGEWLLIGTVFLCRGVEKFLKLIVVMSAQVGIY